MFTLLTRLIGFIAKKFGEMKPEAISVARGGFLLSITVFVVTLVASFLPIITWADAFTAFFWMTILVTAIVLFVENWEQKKVWGETAQILMMIAGFFIGIGGGILMLLARIMYPEISFLECCGLAFAMVVTTAAIGAWGVASISKDRPLFTRIAMGGGSCTWVAIIFAGLTQDIARPFISLIRGEKLNPMLGLVYFLISLVMGIALLAAARGIYDVLFAKDKKVPEKKSRGKDEIDKREVVDDTITTSADIS